jgi:mRNA interferase YafQ
MMINFAVSPDYERDCQRICRRQYYDKEKHLMAEVLLILREKLSEEYKDHKLTGNRSDSRLIHIGGRKSDWVLMYKITNNILCFERTGTHGDVLNIE